MELLKERWVPITGYEGRYEVSDHGRVKSVQRFRRGKSGSMVPIPEKVMRLQVKKRSASGRTLPYVEVRLRDGSPREVPCKVFLVHRLVAQAFVGELFEGAQVDHKDGEHQHNHWTNLRILTPQQHGLLHPCIQDKERYAQMQRAAQETVRALREAGKIKGRYRVE
jgi:NUMOD4 motif/HNH endonuclease